MFLDCLQSHLAVCAQLDLPAYAKRDPGFWNLISIREPSRPTIDTRNLKKVHQVFFHDVMGPDTLPEKHSFVIPSIAHVRAIYDFADSVAGEPILVHCWAGISRSTAVALLLICRALHYEGLSLAEIAQEAPDLLIAFRPQASPNPLILRLGFELFLDPAETKILLEGVLNHPMIFGNRFPGASPSD